MTVAILTLHTLERIVAGDLRTVCSESAGGLDRDIPKVASR